MELNMTAEEIADVDDDVVVIELELAERMDDIIDEDNEAVDDEDDVVGTLKKDEDDVVGTLEDNEDDMADTHPTLT
jgi:hypothetical protein